MKRGGENIFSLPFFVAMLLLIFITGGRFPQASPPSNPTDPFKRKSAANICLKTVYIRLAIIS